MGNTVRFPLHLHPLVTQKLQTRAPMNSATPVSPEERLSSDAEGMQKHTHLARLFGGAAIPLALLAQRAGPTTVNARRIDDAQTAIDLSTSLLEVKRLPCRAPKRPVRLERKV
jgi:hypothetical protein